MQLVNWIKMWHNIHCSPITATFSPYDLLNILHSYHINNDEAVKAYSKIGNTD
jgi:hypothetical protein